MEYFRSSLQRREDITACHILMRFRVRPGLTQKQISMVGRYQVKTSPSFLRRLYQFKYACM